MKMASALDLTVAKSVETLYPLPETEEDGSDASPSKYDQRKTLHCNHCNYVTDRSSNLKRHNTSVHLYGKSMLECCGKLYQSKTDLRVHSLSAHKGLFHCSECKRVFSQKNILDRHMRTHRESLFRCRECSFDTHNKIDYEEHLHSHLKHDRRVLEASFSKSVDGAPSKAGECSVNPLHSQFLRLSSFVTGRSTTAAVQPMRPPSAFMFIVSPNQRHLNGGSCTAEPPVGKIFAPCHLSPSTGSLSDGSSSCSNVSYNSDETFADLPDMEAVPRASTPSEKNSTKVSKETSESPQYHHKKLRNSQRLCSQAIDNV